jgi:hypothetical protein
LKALRNDNDERLQVEAARQDPAHFAELYENNFERVYAYIAGRVTSIFVRFAMQRGSAGLTIKDVFTLYREHQLKIGKNYPYYLVDSKFVQFLRREGKTSKGKRYYWEGPASE